MTVNLEQYWIMRNKKLQGKVIIGLNHICLHQSHQKIIVNQHKKPNLQIDVTYEDSRAIVRAIVRSMMENIGKVWICASLPPPLCSAVVLKLTHAILEGDYNCMKWQGKHTIIHYRNILTSNPFLICLPCAEGNRAAHNLGKWARTQSSFW